MTIQSATERKYILVYAEQGADYQNLLDTLKQTYRPYQNVSVLPVTKQELLSHEPLCPRTVIAFFLPGGGRARYDQSLGTDGFDILRSYTEDGGCFIGICAGAYYASSRIEWKLDPKTEKSADLRLFFGTATGPIIPLTQHNKGEGNWYDATITPVSCYPMGCKAFAAHSLYWGGPAFIPDPKYQPTYETFARFDDLPNRPACIIKERRKRGLVILSAIHPEVKAAQIARFVTGEYHSVEFGQELAAKLQHYDITRQKLWLSLVNEITEHRKRLHHSHFLTINQEQKAHLYE